MNFILDYSEEETNGPEEDSAFQDCGWSDRQGAERRSLPAKKLHKKSFERSQSLASIPPSEDPDILQNLSLLHQYNSASANRKFIKHLCCPAKEAALGTPLAPRKSFSSILEAEHTADDEALLAGAPGPELRLRGLQQEASARAVRPGEGRPEPGPPAPSKHSPALGAPWPSSSRRGPTEPRPASNQLT